MSDFVENSGRNGAGGKPESPAVPQPDMKEIDPAQVLAVLRRRWWMVALFTVLAVAAAWMIQIYRGNTYTASTLIEKKATQQSPLDQILGQTGGPGVASDVMASQVEVMRSEVVLGAVVDSLHLQVASPDGYGAVRRAFGSITLARTAGGRSYVAEPVDGVLELRAAGGGVVGRAAPGGAIDIPGLRLTVRSPLALDGPLDLKILYREQAIDQLRRALDIHQIGETSLIRASYTAASPRVAADVVNALASAATAYSATLGREQARRRRAFIAGQMRQISDSLRLAQNTQLRYQESSGTVDPAEEGQALISALMDAEKDFRKLQYEDDVLAGLTKSLQRSGDVDEALRRAVALGSDLVPGIETLYGRLLDLKAQRDKLTASKYGYTASGPAVQVTDSLIASARGEIRALTGQSLQVVQARRAAAQQRVAALEGQIRNLPGRTTEYARLREQADAIKSTYDLLAGKYYEAQIAEAVEGGDIDIVDAATVPVLPDPKHTTISLILALVIGLILGTGAAFLLDYFDSSIREPEDAERAAGLRLLGTIPQMPALANGNGNGTRVVVGRTDEPIGAEAFRALRTMIRFSRASRPRLIGITSGAPGEGKSSVAANLAFAVAQEAKRVLLIDADLRRPTVHRTFRVSRSPGLTDVLVGEAKLEHAVTRIDGSTIDVLPCGTEAPNPAELLGSPALAELLGAARAAYDLVLVNTPPVLAVTDAAVLAPEMEGLILVARARVTDRRMLADAAEVLRQVGGSLLGVVINNVPLGGGYKNPYHFQYAYGPASDKSSNGTGRLRRLVGRFVPHRS